MNVKLNFELKQKEVQYTTTHPTQFILTIKGEGDYDELIEIKEKIIKSLK